MQFSIKNSKFVSLFVFLTGLLLCNCAGIKETDPEILQLQKILQQNPSNAQNHLILSNLYLNKSQSQKHYLDRAITEAKEAIRQKPDSGPAHLLLSGALIVKASETLDDVLLDESKRELEYGLRLSPDKLNCKDCLNAFCWRSTTAAQVYIEKSLKNATYIESAIKELKDAISLYPDCASAHTLLGLIYLHEQNKKELARVELEQAAKLDADNPAIRSKLGGIYYDQGISDESCLDKITIDKAITEYKAVLKLKPDDIDSRQALSVLYEAKGFYDLALFELKEIVNFAKNAENLNDLGGEYIFKGDFESAITQFEKALNLDAYNLVAHQKLGIIYFLLNKPEYAQKQFNAFLQHARPRDSKSMHAVLHQALFLIQTGNLNEAESIMKDYASQNKDKVWQTHIISYLRNMITESDLLSRARHDCDRCEAFYYIGSQYLLKGHKEKAEEYFQKATDTNIFPFFEYAAAKARLEQLKSK